MPKYVIAVSGGVDSMVLLDALHTDCQVRGADLWGAKAKGELIVAHFDHGIRADSVDDAQFVARAAERRGLLFETKREELGPGASEELARDRRYEFLRLITKKYDGQLITAHHEGDIGETVAINITRGTGWRGLAVLDSPAIWRPLLPVTKQEIKDYAQQYSVAWHEDSTNTDMRYLRNSLRQKLADSDDVLRQLAALRARQVEIKQYIDTEVKRFNATAPHSRYFFGHCGDEVAIELLRAACLKHGSSLTIPQRRRVLHAIKVAKPGTTIEAGDGIVIRFSRAEFVVSEA